jgi:hypothetical protein
VKEAYPPRPGAGDPEHGLFGPPPPGQDWDGAQTTIQLWDADPLLSNSGTERTLRTIFTHDHLGPSTHQQVGLYAGLVVEPEGSLWYLPDGERMNSRVDGGPTNWEGYVVTSPAGNSYREFAIEFQDTQLAYANTSRSTVGNDIFQPAPRRATGATAFDVGATQPPKTRNEIAAFIAILDRAQLPSAFPQIFTANGIPLSAAAKVTVVEPNNRWSIQDPAQAALFGGTSYAVSAANFTAVPVGGGLPPVMVPTSLNVAPSIAGPAAFDVAATPPAQNRNEIGGFIAILDRGQLPAAFPQIFFANGIPLSSTATVTVIDASNRWRIREAPGAAVNAGASYIVWATNFITQAGGVVLPIPVPTSLYVATPEIAAGWADPGKALNPPLPLAGDPAFPLGSPFPQLVSNGRIGTYSMNYRNESVIARVSPLAASDQLVQQIDMSFGFNSLTDRRDKLLNVQPTPGSPIDPGQPGGFKYPPPAAPVLKPPFNQPHVPGVNEPGDPFTPLMRAYAGDAVQVRTLVGAHTLAHSFQIQGVRWSFEPYYLNSGYKNAQGMGISEHFEMLFKLPPVAADHGQGLPPFADYLVSPSSTVEGLANGDWTIMRAFASPSGRPDTPSFLKPLPNNPIEGVPANRQRLADRIKQVKADFEKLDKTQDQVVGNLRVINVTATTVFQALPERSLTFNSRKIDEFQLNNFFLFVPTADLDASGRLKPDAPREPLILRARAGEWILVNLTNALPAGATSDPVLTMTTGVGGGSPFNPPDSQTGLGADPSTVLSLPKGSIPPAQQSLFGSVLTSRQIGLHPALVNYDITDSNGISIGFNPPAAVAPGQTRSFLWYAGYLSVDDLGVHEEPIEYGATNLVSAEMMVQPQFGLVGALIVEPPGSNWSPDLGTRASATVQSPSGKGFREFVLVGQNVVANKGWGALNYKTESFDARQPLPAPTLGYAKAFANAQLNPPADPVTPIFRAAAGTPVRFRLVMPSTSTVAQAPFVFRIHGHGWQEEPYIHQGTRIGSNDRSQFFGAQQVVPYESFNFVLDQAGGPFNVKGDYLYETFQQSSGLGTWGLFRVEDGLVAVTSATRTGNVLTLSGIHQPAAAADGKPATIRVSSPAGPLGEASVAGHTWTFTTPNAPSDSVTLTIRSSLGGQATIAMPPPASTVRQKVAASTGIERASNRP